MHLLEVRRIIMQHTSVGYFTTVARNIDSVALRWWSLQSGLSVFAHVT